MNISATIYKYFFKENNSTTCHMVSENDSESSVECSMNFTCSVYYEKGYEVSETTTLTVTGLDGENYYLQKKPLFHLSNQCIFF